MSLLNPVTVVIPVYGKPEFGRRAVQSVLEYVDLTHNRLIVINDGGSERDVVREQIETLLSNVPSATYFENESNLGFVQASNRAVNELDQTENDILILNSDAALTAGALEEMAAVLELSERHAVVVPRTQHGTIASLPIYPREQLTEQESFALFTRQHKLLPRYSIVPSAPGFCILFRRNVIENYGLFDPWFSPGYDEENDFNLRVNAAGYSTVLANHAYVFHEGSQSFGNRKSELQASNEQEILRRYPYYLDLISQYFTREIDPIDVFMGFLEPTEHPRVLIDCSSLGSHIDGTSKNIMSFVNFLRSQHSKDSLGWDVTILAPKQGIEFFHLHELPFQVISAEAGCNQIFDVGVALSPIWSLESLFLLSEQCVRIVVSHLDIIALRIGKLKTQDTTREWAALAALEWADLSVFISKSSLADVKAYSPGLSIRSSVVIPQGNPVQTDLMSSLEAQLDWSEGFSKSQNHGLRVLVVGNAYPHKQVQLALDALVHSDCEVIALSSRNLRRANVCEMTSGKQPEQFITKLYEQADVVVFPSAYEGYGLPIPQGVATGKPIIVFDTQTAREVVAGLSAEQSVKFFSRFSELENLVKLAGLTKRQEISRLRTINDYNADFVDAIYRVLAQPVNVSHLRARVRRIRGMGVGNSQNTAKNSWLVAQSQRRVVRFITPIADLVWGPIYKRWGSSRKN